MRRVCRAGRRLGLLALLVGGVLWWQRRRDAAGAVASSGADPEGPAFGAVRVGPAPPAAAPVVAARPPAAAAVVTQPDVGWVAPVDGECPPGYPVKANAGSGIFHVPGGRFYARTRPERCYPDAASAAADGYRQAKA